MAFLSRLVPKTAKGIGISSVVLVIFVLFAWQGLRAWWLMGFSKGSRTGQVRKFSYKGSPLCKYWSGELAQQGPNIATAEVWEFTVDGPRDNNPLIEAIRKAEASGARTTLSYRQDKGRWWSCAPTEYYVTGVSSSP